MRILGELVPNDVVLELLKKAMIKHIDKTKAFLINSYPREEAQGHAFEKNIAPVTVSFELFIRLSVGFTSDNDELVE